MLLTISGEWQWQYKQLGHGWQGNIFDYLFLFYGATKTHNSKFVYIITFLEKKCT